MQKEETTKSPLARVRRDANAVRLRDSASLGKILHGKREGRERVAMLSVRCEREHLQSDDASASGGEGHGRETSARPYLGRQSEELDVVVGIPLHDLAEVLGVLCR